MLVPIDRREIPAIESSCRSETPQVILERSYSFGRGEPVHVCRGESLNVWVKVHPQYASQARVRFFSTVEDELDDTPHYDDCKYGGDGLFISFFVPARTGVFVFRASYSLDGGTSWTLDEAPYTWLIVEPHAFNDIRMYTMIPTVSGHIGKWKAQLDDIRRLGCNAVHLLPVTFMDESESPYSAHDLFSIDPSYLDPDDPRDGLAQWEDFVERAKSLEIRLCIDLVLNHVGLKSRIARQRPEWIVPDAGRADGVKRAGCWAGPDWHTWEDVLLLNYGNTDSEARDSLWAYMAEYAMFWANYAAHTVGMVRFDNLHSSSPEFIGALTRNLRRQYPDLTLLAEFFSDEDTLVRRSNEWDLDLLLATPWDYKFVPELRAYLKSIHRLSDQIRFMVPVSSHDSGSPVQDFWSTEATYPRYATAALLSFGATGLSQGVECGVEQKVQFVGRNRRVEMKQSEMLVSFITRVNEIQRNYQAFHLTQNCFFVDEGHSAVIAAVRRDPLRPHECFLVAANFDSGAGQGLEVDLAPFLSGAGEITTEELITRAVPSVLSGTRLSVELRPCQVKVLRCRCPRKHRIFG